MGLQMSFSEFAQDILNNTLFEKSFKIIDSIT